MAKRTPFTVKSLKDRLSRAAKALAGKQSKEGYWVYDLEADATITAEYIMFNTFIDREMDPKLLAGMVKHLLKKQLPDGGWPLYDVDGHSDLSCSVKAYFALKLAGHSAGDEHMVRARKLILSLGGAAQANVFTRITLCLFGQMPWRLTPCMPVEIMFLPRWFFFHLSKVSYWSRSVIVPLLILYAMRPVCRLRLEQSVQELFVKAPDRLFHVDQWIPGGPWRKNMFLMLDRVVKKLQPLIPKSMRARAIREAERWTREHMQGEGGIGAIFPAMVNAVEALRVLGYPEDDPDYVRGLKAVDDLVVRRADGEAFCQPCVSPIWDTCLSLSALLEAGVDPSDPGLKKAMDWLWDNQIFQRGDWADKAPDLAPGGWAFQFENTLYPDFDDTSMVLMALLRGGALERQEDWTRMARGVNWLVGLQSEDGGWGAFDRDNCHHYLNDIPFADHGALLDPSTSDLTARCIELLSMLGFDRDYPPIARGIEFLKKEQEKCGAWFGRWGVNYLYGTWSVLVGLRQVGEDMNAPYVRKAVDWLKQVQNQDGGWGETCFSYDDPSMAGKGYSTPSQTAWALLGLMAAGEVRSEAVTRGVDHLLKTQNDKGLWDEELWTGTGFPRVFYLRYHGYREFFPVWALGVYARMREGKPTRQDTVRLGSASDLPLAKEDLRALPEPNVAIRVKTVNKATVVLDDSEKN